MELIAILNDSKTLKGILDVMSFLIDETYLYAYPTGIKMSAIDSSHVAMFLANLPKTFFNEYKCKNQFKIGLNVADMSKILRRAKTDDTLELICKEKEPNMLLIRMKSSKSTRTFKLKSKEIQEYDEKEENIMENFEETLKDKFTANITMEGALLEEVVKDASIISDLLKIQILSAENQIIFQARNETGEVETELDLKGECILDSEVKDDSEGLYSLNFLENIIKIQSFVNSLKLKFGNNIPVEIEGILGDDDTTRVVYLLAPRVEDNDNDVDIDDIDAEFNDEDLTDANEDDGEEEE